MGEMRSAWEDGELPGNVRVGERSVIKGQSAFRRMRSNRDDALVIGADCACDGVQFSIGADGRIIIGDHCYLSSVVLMAELEIRIGSFVMIGWNTAIADSDFHPLGPALRIADAVACSPLGEGAARPKIEKRGVVIGDDVWIGANCTILKGVHIGSGAFIEPGSVVTRDVAARVRVLGNPAQVIGEV